MKMRKTRFAIVATVLIISSTACKNNAKEEAKQNATNLTTYVDSLKNVTPSYTTGYWNILDEGYQQRALLAEKSMADLEAIDKAKLDSTKAQYAALKSNYDAQLKTQELNGAIKLNETEAQLEIEKNKNNGLPNPAVSAPVSDYRQILRNRLFGEGKIGADMKFEYVTASNILGIYDSFVNSVSDNKNTYTREDWDEIKVLYEALDNRKNTIEKDLDAKDNRKIAGLKVRFASIKATKRTPSKVDENSASKN